MAARTKTYIDRTVFDTMSKANQLLTYLTWRQTGVSGATLRHFAGKDVNNWLTYMRKNGWIRRRHKASTVRYVIGTVPVAKAAHILRAIKTVKVTTGGRGPGAPILQGTHRLDRARHQA
jgi:hypothetical protein